MIWIFITAVVTIVGILLWALFHNDCGSSYSCACFGELIAVAGGVILAVLLIVVAVAHSPLQAEKEKAMTLAQREALVYQINNNIYLGDAVGKFNSELIEAQMEYQSPWTNWFHAGWVMEIEPIEFNGRAE